VWVPVKNQFNVRKLNLLKVCSIFSQALNVFSRGEFEKAVKEQKVERHARGFSGCGQFLAPAVLPVGAANPGCIAGVVDGLDDHTKDRESLALDVARLDGSAPFKWPRIGCLFAIAAQTSRYISSTVWFFALTTLTSPSQ
jgi:hypothetical protein